MRNEISSLDIFTESALTMIFPRDFYSPSNVRSVMKVYLFDVIILEIVVSQFPTWSLPLSSTSQTSNLIHYSFSKKQSTMKVFVKSGLRLLRIISVFPMNEYLPVLLSFKYTCTSGSLFDIRSRSIKFRHEIDNQILLDRALAFELYSTIN